MVKCNTCGREFATQAALAQHAKDKHQVEGQRVSESQDRQQESKTKRKSLRRRNRHPVAIGLAAAAVIFGLGLYFAVAPSLAPPPIPCSSGETRIHVHPYLSISIEGTPVTVPAAIGYLNRCPSGLEEMHAHDASGIIHIELSQTDSHANFTLADFFRVWSAIYPTVSINGTSHPVEFTNTNIFGFSTDATHKVVVLVDGKAVANGAGVLLEQLDYCDSTNSNVPPCSGTAQGNPLWNGGSNYPYGTGHTIVIEYVAI